MRYCHTHTVGWKAVGNKLFRQTRHFIHHTGLLWGVLLLVGCHGKQSALDPAGREAEQLAGLFWWMTAGAVVVWLGVVVLGIYAIRVRPESIDERRVRLLI